MAGRIDRFVDALLRERGDQWSLLPEEPVTMVKDGKPRKVSRQPLTDQHIYALLVEVAPSESADHIDQMTETEFEYIADRGMVRVRIVPDMGRLTAMVARVENSAATQSPATGPAPAAQRAPAGAGATAPAAPPPRPPKPSAIAAAPMVEAPAPGAAGTVDFAAAQYKGAERALGELLKALVQSTSSDLHLRVGEPPVFRTHGEMKRQATPPVSSEQLEMMLLSVMPERNRGEWKETGDSDFAYEIGGLARFRVNAARDRKGPIAVFRVIPAKVVSVEQLGISKEVQQLCYLTKGLVLVTGPTGSGKSTTLCALVDLINRTRTDHIITIEDPIEFVHENKKCVIAQTLCKRLGGGRVAAREILLTTPAISNLIREGKTFQIPSIIQTSKQLGMLTLNDALVELVEKKEISPDEAYVKSVEKTGLAASLKAKGHKLTITA